MLYFHRFKQDYLIFEGSDRLDLINRLSTNQVISLQKYHEIKTVLTSDKGRFVDLLTLFNFGDFVFTTCSFNNAENIISHLDRYTIMDDFKVKNMAGTHETVIFTGDGAEDLAADILGTDIGNLPNSNFSICKHGERDGIIARNNDAFGGFIFICSAGHYDYWISFILSESNVNKFGLNELNGEQYEEKRINLGIPAFGKEMSEHTNPLECGLNQFVSFTKGCYIGQEVIARLDTYEKISKHLVKIDAEEAIPDSASKIMLEGRECGFITSKIKNTGLGFVKTNFLDYNKTYTIKNNELTINSKIKKINK